MHECPFCLTPLKVDVSLHALERLDERAFPKFIFTSGINEDKKTWMRRFAIEVIQKGDLMLPQMPDHVYYWYQGFWVIFVKIGDLLLLKTLYRRGRPKAAQFKPQPAKID